MGSKRHHLKRLACGVLLCAGAGCMPARPDGAAAVEAPARPDDRNADNDYTAALARVRRGECEGVFWRAGACGDVLFIAVGGLQAVVDYYDPETGRWIRREIQPDHGPMMPSRIADCMSEKVEEESGLCGPDVP